MAYVLDTKSAWDAGDRTVGGKLNFSGGLTIPSVGMLLGNWLGDGQAWIKSEVDYDTSPNVGGSKRDEFQLFKNGTNLYVPNKFYAFDIYLPDFAYDDRNMCVMQFKHISTFNTLKMDYYPFVSLNIRPQGGVLKFATVRQWSDTYRSATPKYQPITWMDAVQSNRKYRFVYEINWSHESDGYVKVYIDGVLLYTINGPNIDPPPPSGSAPMPLFRLGHYQFTWTNISTPPAVKNRKAYFKDVQVGNDDMTVEQFFSEDAEPTPVGYTLFENLTTGKKTFPLAGTWKSQEGVVYTRKIQLNAGQSIYLKQITVPKTTWKTKLFYP